MRAKALGLIEVVGLPTAIEAADAAAKAANVTIIGYDNAKGGGLITVKLVGDVGAVKAAVSAGSAAALRVGRVVSCLVIPRPHEEIAALVAQVTRGQARRPAAHTLEVLAQPAIGNAEPAIGNAEPAIGNAEPAIGNVEPAIGNAEPAIGNVEPAIGNVEPAIGNAEPAIGNAEPADGNAPALEQRKPVATKRGRLPKSDPPATPESGEVEG